MWLHLLSASMVFEYIPTVATSKNLNFPQQVPQRSRLVALWSSFLHLHYGTTSVYAALCDILFHWRNWCDLVLLCRPREEGCRPVERRTKSNLDWKKKGNIKFSNCWSAILLVGKGRKIEGELIETWKYYFKRRAYTLVLAYCSLFLLRIHLKQSLSFDSRLYFHRHTKCNLVISSITLCSEWLLFTFWNFVTVDLLRVL